MRIKGDFSCKCSAQCLPTLNAHWTVAGSSSFNNLCGSGVHSERGKGVPDILEISLLKCLEEYRWNVTVLFLLSQLPWEYTMSQSDLSSSILDRNHQVHPLALISFLPFRVCLTITWESNRFTSHPTQMICLQNYLAGFSGLSIACLQNKVL